MFIVLIEKTRSKKKSMEKTIILLIIFTLVSTKKLKYKHKS